VAGTVTVPKAPMARARIGRWLDIGSWLLALAALAYLIQRNDSGPPTGGRAAAFELPLLGTSGRFHFAGTRERPLLVEVFASWCAACRRSAPALEELRAATVAGKLDVLLVSVDETRAAALGAQRSWPIDYPLAFDERGAFQRAYQVSVLPTFILIAADGRILDVSVGPPGASDLRTWQDPE
jgi:cytochrome c biogenesis protein CcmG/thiol:disulfide interchange protein DsbE